MTNGVRVIKKYGNRKLYDTEASKYVTLTDIIGYVKGGDSVQVVSNNTKQDITGEVLFNALVEQEKGTSLPVESLVGLIRGPGSLSGYISNYNVKTEGGQ